MLPETRAHPGTLPVSQSLGARKTQEFRVYPIGNRDTESQQGPDMRPPAPPPYLAVDTTGIPVQRNPMPSILLPQKRAGLAINISIGEFWSPQEALHIRLRGQTYRDRPEDAWGLRKPFQTTRENSHPLIQGHSEARRGLRTFHPAEFRELGQRLCKTRHRQE